MYYVYLIKSQKDKSLYIGYTDDLRRRLLEHNSKQSKYTRNKIPWRLVYYESFSNKQDAIIRERKLKEYKSSYGHLIKRIRNSIDED